MYIYYPKSARVTVLLVSLTVKHLVESQPKNSKADAIISCAGGVIDLEDKKLECALRRGNRIEDDGWLQWEKKHALEIGIDFHADSDEDLIMVKK